ncbi:MAG: C4-dicarboxylate TRAP transporter substrate-binding protein [Marinobacter sp.]
MIKNNILKVLFFGVFLIFGVAGQALAELNLRYAEGGPNRGVRADALKYFVDELDRRSDGELKIDVHWGGALIKYGSILEGIAGGTADLGTMQAAYHPQKMRVLSVGDIPVSESDAWVGMRAMYELMTTNDQMEKAFSDNEVVYITNYTTTSLQFECQGDAKLKSLDDFKGKRVRAPALYGKILSEFGVNLVNMGYGEVYQALDSGLLDCSGGYFYAMRAFKTAEVADSVTAINWGQIAGMGIVMNKWTWDELTKERQNLMRKVGSEMIDFYAERVIKENKDVERKLPTGELGNKVEVIYWSEEERARLFEYSEKYIQGWIEDMNKAGFDGQDVWDSYQALLKKYRNELESNGYPWDRV